MKPKALPLLERCIEDGVDLGWLRAHKHDDNPADIAIKDKIVESVLAQIHDWFDFEELQQ